MRGVRVAQLGDVVGMCALNGADCAGVAEVGRPLVISHALLRAR